MINDYPLPTHVWEFSSSSQSQLLRCLNAVKPNTTNKWSERFQKTLNTYIVEKTGEIAEIETIQCVDNEKKLITNENVTDNKQYEEFCREIVDADPVKNFDSIVERCLKDTNLYEILANTLSNNAIEKICYHIFDSKNINMTFIEQFYKFLLPSFLKKEHTIFSLHLLVKANESHPIQFKKLLEILMSDKEVSSNVLKEYVTTLNAKDKSNFLLDIINIDIQNEVFVHNLFTIFTAYKDGFKTVDINNYILSKLTQVAQNCCEDKTYGRFLLTYIQSQIGSNTDIKVLEHILENHRSPFKKPCMNALNNLKKK